MDFFDSLSQNFTKFRADQERKKSQDNKRDEMKKVFGYVGMEAFDLYKKGKLESEELQVYFDRLTTLEREISEIDAVIEAERRAEDGDARVCSCGRVLTADAKFCPQCGKAVTDELPFAGEENGPVPMVPESRRECICGEPIAEGQTICMACGRKVQ